ncbi:hypothetical protein [Kribbella solani]|uniref:DUF4352 domain-containing protein n=1 Tax=Kribbella solani TaxID=236067 RepID=A0A841DTL2_9ACTN|nr:hypothetical protein [Kribbella solani]
MESLDEIIDAMIADRVIHRHRRIWLVVIALVVVAALVVLATGGWKERKGRSVPTLTAPATVTAGRYEFDFTTAVILRKPKTDYSEAETRLRVSFKAKNIDSEEHKSQSPDSGLLLFVPGHGADLVDATGITCRGEVTWVLVYGLPPEDCYTEFKVEPDFKADEVEIGVQAESFEATSGVFGANDTKFWQNEAPVAVVRFTPSEKTDGGSK